MLHIRTPNDTPLIGNVLLALDASWRQPATLTILRAFIACRVAGGRNHHSGRVWDTWLRDGTLSASVLVAAVAA